MDIHGCNLTAEQARAFLHDIVRALAADAEAGRETACRDVLAVFREQVCPSCKFFNKNPLTPLPPVDNYSGSEVANGASVPESSR